MTLRSLLPSISLTLYATLLLAIVWPGGVPDPFGVGDRYAWIVVTWGLAVPLCVAHWLRGIPLRTPLDRWILASVAVAALTWPTAADRVETAAAIAALIGQIAVCYATVGLTRERPAAAAIILATLVTGIAVIQLQAFDFHVEQGLLTRPKVYERPTGWSGYPEISHLAVVQLAILIAFLQTSHTWRARLSIATLLAVGAIELVLLYARMAWLALAGVIVAAGIVTFREGQRLLVIGLVCLAVAGGGWLAWKNSTIQRLAFGMVGLSERAAVDPAAPSLQIATPAMRLDIWRRTGRMIGDHWLTGVGLGNFTTVYESIYNPELNDDLRRGGHAHSYWLQQAAELGVVGGAIVMMLWVTALRTAWTRRTWSVAQRAALYVLLAIAFRHLADNLFFSVGGASARLQSIAWLIFAMAALPGRPPNIDAAS